MASSRTFLLLGLVFAVLLLSSEISAQKEDIVEKAGDQVQDHGHGHDHGHGGYGHDHGHGGHGGHGHGHDGKLGVGAAETQTKN
ncbi:kininogen-1-like [Pyrus ussuriensis x Pyrus communis]|uniref:Kininogen-1-like n=1 Tax=Pyrus ussuriensis x Pyrus communis TaxID=2448454 RepID=A0A5N5G9P1_9ROSA|nr:cold and drought-regulated protein CORA-like [Pyrus x bretschneideri]KAB2611917.1 kininogen-1-like [Pyrus ussuriensis x Pyrus communis]